MSAASGHAVPRSLSRNSIPALRLENGSAIVGEENILIFLGKRFAEPLDAEAHRRKALDLRRRYLDEECECLQLASTLGGAGVELLGDEGRGVEAVIRLRAE